MLWKHQQLSILVKPTEIQVVIQMYSLYLIFVLKNAYNA